MLWCIYLYSTSVCATVINACSSLNKDLSPFLLRQNVAQLELGNFDDLMHMEAHTKFPYQFSLMWSKFVSCLIVFWFALLWRRCNSSWRTSQALRCHSKALCQFSLAQPRCETVKGGVLVLLLCISLVLVGRTKLAKSCEDVWYKCRCAVVLLLSLSSKHESPHHDVRIILLSFAHGLLCYLLSGHAAHEHVSLLAQQSPSRLRPCVGTQWHISMQGGRISGRVS